MKNSTKSIIVVTIIILYFLVITAWGAYNVMKQKEDAQTHAVFCSNWSAHLEETKKKFDESSNLGDTVIAQINSEIGDYNRECRY